MPAGAFLTEIHMQPAKEPDLFDNEGQDDLFQSDLFPTFNPPEPQQKKETQNHEEDKATGL